MDDTQPAASPAEAGEMPATLAPNEEKKSEGIEHDRSPKPMQICT
jgi:hypothetical protein